MSGLGNCDRYTSFFVCPASPSCGKCLSPTPRSPTSCAAGDPCWPIRESHPLDLINCLRGNLPSRARIPFQGLMWIPQITWYRDHTHLQLPGCLFYHLESIRPTQECRLREGKIPTLPGHPDPQGKIVFVTGSPEFGDKP